MLTYALFAYQTTKTLYFTHVVMNVSVMGAVNNSCNKLLIKYALFAEIALKILQEYLDEILS